MIRVSEEERKDLAGCKHEYGQTSIEDQSQIVENDIVQQPCVGFS